MDKGYGSISDSFPRSRLILWSSLAVFVGGMIYLLFRPAEVHFFNWFSSLDLDQWLANVRGHSLSLTYVMPHWFVYSLPNGLWAYAYTLLILLIWKGSRSSMKYIWYLSIPVLVFGFELLQANGTLPGTFCPYDLSWGAMGITLGYVTMYLNRNTLKFRR